MIFQFYCDESYDGNPKGNRKIAKDDAPFEPASYIVGGFFSDQTTWNKIDVAWTNKNRRVGVGRYHAAHLNGATYEYNGWSKNRRLQYNGKRNGATEMRKALASMLDTTGFIGYQFGEKTLLEMKKSIEETPSGPNMSVVIPHDPWDPAPYATVETA
jgi:hypothetical protein